MWKASYGKQHPTTPFGQCSIRKIGKNCSAFKAVHQLLGVPRPGVVCPELLVDHSFGLLVWLSRHLKIPPLHYFHMHTLSARAITDANHTHTHTHAFKAAIHYSRLRSCEIHWVWTDLECNFALTQVVWPNMVEYDDIGKLVDLHANFIEYLDSTTFLTT